MKTFIHTSMLYRTTFNCENELHERLKLQAKAEDRTKTAVINRAIKEYLDKHEIKE